jgi:UDP-N-acetylmuramoylalanine-D-glutamate ligase
VIAYVQNSKFKIQNSKLLPYSSKSIDLSKTKFIGKHNAENFAAVYYLVEQIAKENYIDRNDKIFYELIEDIEPLGNRCRKSLIVDGIQFIDDLHATGTHSQSAALGCVEGELILICG